jgi:hypothetical protein
MPPLKMSRGTAVRSPIVVMCFVWFVLGPASTSSAQNRCSARCPNGSMSEAFNCNANYVPVCLRRPTVPRNDGNSTDNGAADRARAEAAAAVEAQRQRDAEIELERIEAENRRRAEEIANQARFNQEKREALGQLKGIADGGDVDFGLKGVSSTDSGLKDGPNSGDSAGLKPVPCGKTDAHVVDGCNVPSGLPKSVDDAIVSGYSSAPPGVSDRVRKGFQAIATHDWKLAKAWFGDALNHDPDNASLKRMFALADYTEKRVEQLNARKSANQSSLLQLPQDSDIYLIFPGEPAPRSTATGRAMQLPEESDIYFLFPGLEASDAKVAKTKAAKAKAAKAAKEMDDYYFDQALKAAENDPQLLKLSKPPERAQRRNPYEVK